LASNLVEAATPVSQTKDPIRLNRSPDGIASRRSNKLSHLIEVKVLWLGQHMMEALAHGWMHDQLPGFVPVDQAAALVSSRSA
jgi:hypothetical protein